VVNLSRFKIITLFILFGISACSTHSRRGGNYGDNGDPSYSQEIQKYYYADVQIVDETIPEGNCAESLKLSDQKDSPSTISLNDRNEIELHPSIKNLRLFGANVALQVMGFDQAHYSFSVIDQSVPIPLPFKFHLKRIPGNLLELQFLDQVVEMKLTATPIYTFSATEQRKDCKLIHHVNVFGEKPGYYPLAD
jgi:hypothetical protein